MGEEAGKSRAQRFQMAAHPLAAGFLTEQVAVSVQGIGIGDYNRGIELIIFRGLLRDRFDTYSGGLAVRGKNTLYLRAFQNVTATTRETPAQIVGKLLRTAFRIVVAKEIGKAQHRIEDIRCLRWHGPPMGRITHQNDFEPGVFEEHVDLLTHGVLFQFLEGLVGHAAEVVKQAVHVGLAQFREVCVHIGGFFREGRLQAPDIGCEVIGHGEGRESRQVELVHGIHANPLGLASQFHQQFSGECSRVAQQRIKMRGRVEDKTLSSKRRAEAAQHVMALQQEHFHAAFGQNIGTDEPADAGANDDGVIPRRVFPAKNYMGIFTHGQALG